MKLSLHPFLYLVSLACTAGIGWSVWDMVKPKQKFEERWVETQGLVSSRWQEGDKKHGDDSRWAYDGRDFWQRFGIVNMVGYVPPPPVEKVEVAAPVVEPVKPDLVLQEILEVRAVMYGGDSDYTGTIIKYKTDVQVPADLAPTGGMSAPASPANPMDTIPRGRQDQFRGTRPMMPQPVPVTSTAAGTPMHHLRLREKLWPPYDYVVLAEVAPDTCSVTFEIQNKRLPDGSHARQEVLRNELGLPEDVLLHLREKAGSRSGAGSTGTGAKGKGMETAPAPTTSAGSTWRDVPETVYDVEKREVMVSRKDHAYIRDQGQEIFKEVNAGDYAGDVGGKRISGVEVRKVSGRLASFGVVSGDVLVSLNGQKVNGIAHAKKVGERLYKDGVRSFQAEILRRGQVITLTYQLDR